MARKTELALWCVNRVVTMQQMMEYKSGIPTWIAPKA
jgi:hypothetical protein